MDSERIGALVEEAELSLEDGFEIEEEGPRACIPDYIWCEAAIESANGPIISNQ